MSVNGAPASVREFFAAFAHPHREAYVALHDIILAADPSIATGIKWNVPSFRTVEYFATLHVRAKTGVAVILHFGAKKRAPDAEREAMADPDGLLAWLADDRAIAAFRDLEDVRQRQVAFTRIVQQWITHVSTA